MQTRINMAGQLASRPLPTDAFLRGPPGTGAAPQQQPDTAQGRDTFPAGPSASAGAASSKGLSLTISPGKARPLGLSAAPAAGANVIRGGRSSGRDGFVYVPRSYHPGRPSPLAVMLHGAGGRADPQSGNWSFGGLQALEERWGRGGGRVAGWRRGWNLVSCCSDAWHIQERAGKPLANLVAHTHLASPPDVRA